MTLARRFLVAFGAVLILVVMAYGYVLHAFRTMADRAAVEQRHEAAVEAASRVEASAQEIVLLLEHFLDAPDPDTLLRFYAQRETAAASRRALRTISTDPAVARLIDEYEAILPARMSAAEALITAAHAGRPPAATRAVKLERNGLDQRALALTRRIIEIEHRALTAALDGSAAYRREVVRNFGVLAAAILGATVFISLWTARSVSRRLAPLSEMARDVGNGTFSTRAAVDGSDEIATLARAFNQMAVALAELDRAKDEFVALASHQLRTPATAVKGNLSMLLDGYCGELADEQRQVVADAYQANERQLALIEDMLAAARAELGRLRLARTPADIAALVEEVVAEHRFDIQARGQRVEVTRPEALVGAVDTHKMRMVIDNLVSNASKYTPRGGRIDVRLNRRNGSIALEVSDTGVGIPADAHDKLFRKFSRIDNALAVEAGGTGLGLYLANEIVKLHGGRMAVASAPARGSTFTATWPAE